MINYLRGVYFIVVYKMNESVKKIIYELFMFEMYLK